MAKSIELTEYKGEALPAEKILFFQNNGGTLLEDSNGEYRAPTEIEAVQEPLRFICVIFADGSYEVAYWCDSYEKISEFCDMNFSGSQPELKHREGTVWIHIDGI